MQWPSNCAPLCGDCRSLPLGVGSFGLGRCASRPLLATTSSTCQLGPRRPPYRENNQQLFRPIGGSLGQCVWDPLGLLVPVGAVTPLSTGSGVWPRLPPDFYASVGRPPEQLVRCWDGSMRPVGGCGAPPVPTGPGVGTFGVSGGQAPVLQRASLTLSEVGANAAGNPAAVHVGPLAGPVVIRTVVLATIDTVTVVPYTATYRLWLSRESTADEAPSPGDIEMTLGSQDVVVFNTLLSALIGTNVLVPWPRGFLHVALDSGANATTFALTALAGGLNQVSEAAAGGGGLSALGPSSPGVP